ncbi:hypothetical protein ACWGR4_42250, partial [Embleya sp. NPDC055664]
GGPERGEAADPAEAGAVEAPGAGAAVDPDVGAGGVAAAGVAAGPASAGTARELSFMAVLKCGIRRRAPSG